MALTFPFLRYSVVQLSKTGFGVFAFLGFFSCCRQKLNGTGASDAINTKLPPQVPFINKVHCQLQQCLLGFFSVQSILKHSVGKQKSSNVVYQLYNIQKLYSISQSPHPLLDFELLDYSVSESNSQNNCTNISCLVQTLFTYATGIPLPIYTVQQH